MLKTYLSHSGNRRIYVRIGEIPYTANGRTTMIPENACCQFGSAGVGRYVTDDERIQQALEAHPLHNRDFILLEGKAAELLKNVKSLREIVPEAKDLNERERLIKEAKVLNLRLDLVKASNIEIKSAIDKEKTRLINVTSTELPPTPEAKEIPEVEEKLVDEPVGKKRGRKPKARIEARA